MNLRLLRMHCQTLLVKHTGNLVNSQICYNHSEPESKCGHVDWLKGITFFFAVFCEVKVVRWKRSTTLHQRQQTFQVVHSLHKHVTFTFCFLLTVFGAGFLISGLTRPNKAQYIMRAVTPQPSNASTHADCVNYTPLGSLLLTAAHSPVMALYPGTGGSP